MTQAPRHHLAHALWAGLLGLWACADTAARPASLTLEVTATSTLDEPLSGVRAWLNGHVLGSTDRVGQLSATQTVRGDAPADLLLACPSGYTTREPERRIPLRSAAPGAPTSLRVSVTCQAQQPLAALVIRGAPGLPVLVDGERVGQTDDQGIEHLTLRAPPGTAVQVALDTSGQPELRPESPVRTFELDENDRLLMLDQPFERRRAASRKRRRRPQPEVPPSPPRPTQIQ